MIIIGILLINLEDKNISLVVLPIAMIILVIGIFKASKRRAQNHKNNS